MRTYSHTISKALQVDKKKKWTDLHSQSSPPQMLRK